MPCEQELTLVLSVLTSRRGPLDKINLSIKTALPLRVVDACVSSLAKRGEPIFSTRNPEGYEFRVVARKIEKKRSP